MKKKLLSIVISLAMVLTMIPAMGSVAYAKTVINTIQGTSNIEDTLVLGNKLVNPSFTITSGFASFNASNTMNWHIKVGDTWVRCEKDQTVIPGEYSLRGSMFGIYSSGFINNYLYYELSDQTRVVIDGTDWGTATSYKDTGTYCYITIDSPTFTVEDNPSKKVISSVELESGKIYYNGEAKTPKVIVKDQAGNELVEDTDYLVTYYDNVNVTLSEGAYVLVTGKNGTLGSWRKNFNIEPAPISSVKLSTSTYTYNGNAKNPSLTVKDINGKTLVKDTDYTVAKPTGRTKVGKYTYSVTGQDNYSGTKSASFKINPATASVKSITPGTKKMTVKMTTKPSSKGASSYQIYYKQKGTSTWKKTTTTASYKTIKSLKKGKYYYVKSRAYKKVGTTTYYGAWSKTKLSKKIK